MSYFDRDQCVSFGYDTNAPIVRMAVRLPTRNVLLAQQIEKVFFLLTSKMHLIRTRHPAVLLNIPAKELARWGRFIDASRVPFQEVRTEETANGYVPASPPAYA